MKKGILLVLLLILISPAFSPGINIWTQHQSEVYPFKAMCDELQDINFNFKSDQFKGTKYESMTEFPPEILTYINNQIKSDETTIEAIQSLGNVTFSMNVLYNTTTCLSASFKFNNASELEFFKLEPDPLAGSSDEHVYLHIQLYNLESIMNEWTKIQTGQNFNPVDIISLFFRTIWTIMTSVLGKDIYFKPITGFTKATEALSIVLGESFADLEQNFAQTI